MTVELTHYTKNPILEIEKAASICYNSNPKGDGKIANHCYNSGHHSVFEHVVFSFRISGVSRALTHQLVRHRMASYSQRSQRFCDEDGFDYVTPNSIKSNEQAKRKYQKLMYDISKAYKDLQELGIPNEDARYVLPNACCTEIQVTMNGRELIHFCNERLCSCAQWEIRQLANNMKECIENKLDCAEFAKYLVPKCEAGRVKYCPEAKSRSCGRQPTKEDLFNEKN